MNHLSLIFHPQSCTCKLNVGNVQIFKAKQDTRIQDTITKQAPIINNQIPNRLIIEI